ncbi:transcription termination/antitermination NusG family protein [Pseudochrobactrum sp. HB0163]|uniref:transcription termination/antitermination NusG family protein n=1 Tax=Pseudochrobactrum sp. HB0163 TaxID=3450708 RepID=UPI003F6E0938
MMVADIDKTRILEAANRLASRDPDRIRQRIQAKFLKIAAGSEAAERQWFVLKTAHRKEKDVYNSVQDAGIEAWLPMKKQTRLVKYTTKKKVVEVPVFNGYLFVKAVPCAESWVGLSRIDGAVSLIFGQQGALVVSEKYMSDLMVLTNAGAFNEGAAMPRYAQGERVRFPIAGSVFEGVLEGYVGKRAARVLSFIFGHERVIEVPLANLKKYA